MFRQGDWKKNCLFFFRVVCRLSPARRENADEIARWRILVPHCRFASQHVCAVSADVSLSVFPDWSECTSRSAGGEGVAGGFHGGIRRVGTRRFPGRRDDSWRISTAVCGLGDFQYAFFPGVNLRRKRVCVPWAVRQRGGTSGGVRCRTVVFARHAVWQCEHVIKSTNIDLDV